jgi:hypothetical protein
MFSRPDNGPRTRVTGCASLLAVAVLCWAGGCRDGAEVQLDNSELATFVRLMMPKTIEIQHHLTKPFDFGGTGNADGLEVILATFDSLDDPVKCVGTFHFELHTMRMASGDKLGQRVAFWTVTIDSDKTLVQYWDRYSRYYCFRLKLSSGTLPPGRYVLSARLITPTGDKLFDDYEFAYERP